MKIQSPSLPITLWIILICLGLFRPAFSSAKIFSSPLRECSSVEKIKIPGSSGAGPYHVTNAWIAAFTAIYNASEIPLTNVGSGAAQGGLWGDINCEENPIQGGVCDDEGDDERNNFTRSTLWGIGDAPLNSTAIGYENYSDLRLQQLPACAGAIIPAHSRDVTGDMGSRRRTPNPLNMSFAILGGIFNGSIDMWDDPLISKINPYVTLPKEKINVLVRSDSSGQSYIFSNALNQNLDDWSSNAVGMLPDWSLPKRSPVTETKELCKLSESNASLNYNTPHHFEGKGSDGVTLGLLRIPYSIGYMQMGIYDGLHHFLGQVQVSTESNPNVFVTASSDTLITAMRTASMDPDTFDVNLAKQTPPGGFPISGFAYWYVKRDAKSYDNCYQAWLLCKFIEWTWTDPRAAEIALEHGRVTPPKFILQSLLDKLKEVQCIEREGELPISALSYNPNKSCKGEMGISNSEEDNPVSTLTWMLACAVVVLSVWYIAHTLLTRRKRRGILRSLSQIPSNTPQSC